MLWYHLMGTGFPILCLVAANIDLAETFDILIKLQITRSKPCNLSTTYATLAPHMTLPWRLIPTCELRAQARTQKNAIWWRIVDIWLSTRLLRDWYKEKPQTLTLPTATNYKVFGACILPTLTGSNVIHGPIVQDTVLQHHHRFCI